MKKVSFWILLLTCLGIVAGLVSVNTGHAEYGDVVLNSKSESMKKAGVNPVVFPHWFHRIRFKCKVCHEDIFILKKGANDINMTKIMEGEFCGKCHNGLIAWEPLYCDRCHSYTGTNPDAPTNQN
jgi:c(7)-type cytochrome triheme protein